MLSEPMFMCLNYDKKSPCPHSVGSDFLHMRVCFNTSVQTGRDEVQISSNAAAAEGEGVAITRGKGTLETHLNWPMNQQDLEGVSKIKVPQG